MKNLRYGSRGPDVILLEKFLKSKGYYVIVDPPGRGHYGPNLSEAVYWYQKNEKLYPDKRFGPACRASMNKAGMCRYQEVAKYDIQTSIVRMHLKHTSGEVINPRAQTIKQMMDGHTVVVNGTLFDTRTMTDLARLKKNNKVVGGQYYDDDGLCISQIGAVSIGKDSKLVKDFAGFSPAVILNNTVNTDFKHLNSEFLNTRAPRTMFIVTDNYLTAMVVRGRSKWRGWVGANFDDLVRLTSQIKTFENSETVNSGIVDGGYSSGIYTFLRKLYGWASRKVANGLGFKVEGF